MIDRVIGNDVKESRFSCHIDSAPTPCEELKDKTCDETEFEAYRACIEASRGKVRDKRQIDMPCQQPRVVEPIVQTVKPFEMFVPVKPLKIVQKPELKTLDRTIIVQPGSNLTDDYPDDEESNFHYRLPLNVTTVIRLTNIVNNTNNIHMPTTLNNTNVNNIHVYANLTEQGDVPFEQDERCCTVVRPKSCQTSTQGVHCKHRKFQTCGPQCTAKVMHIQKRKRCKRSTGECEEKIAYVPQPEKPTCVYIEEWPFVVCGKQANMTIICAGCYDHYGRGYQAAYGHSRMQPQCVGCYDDAFNTNDWGVPTAKCAVVSDGNTITVKNCTDEVDNPFVAAPKLPSSNKGTKGGNTKHSPKPSQPPPTTTRSTEAPSSKDAPSTTTQAPEKEDVEKSTDAVTNPDDEPGSGIGPMNNEVYFVEEYIDDEDFML
ncbi:AGAP002583-PA-like protein [Anopheles sinensis]|uniref:AGAP002583-PA-like protein n=1 Tax=Anopheles sinensis TaxID=74873 RepID=A0A084WTD9_ANOSI|nr:AGAP002583-PA-like protein [Anopheles sinensis]